MTQASDDQLLIERAQEGDRAAFDTLVSRYEERAYKYAYRLTRNQDLAADIVADSFIRVYRALKNFRGQSAFSTWLYRIVTNCFLDRRKRNKEQGNVSMDDHMEVSTGAISRQYEDDGPGPDELAERNARESAIQGALEHLPDYQKAMLIMYHVEAKSYEDIAATLDLPIGTVKSRLNRARVALRDQLDTQMELFQIG